MTVHPALAIRGLTKDFGAGLGRRRLRAVDGLSLEVEAGQVHGLFGPNGSGKSTAVRVVLGLLQATAGDCRVFGHPGGSIEARRETGYLPEAPYFHRRLTGRQLLAFYGGICGMAGADLRSRIEEVLAWAGLAAAGDRLVGTYSKGMQQRIGVAQAVLHRPRLVILDEPGAGLDCHGMAAVADLVLQLKAAGRAVLVVSHQLAQMEEICDSATILDRGQKVWSGPLSGSRDAAAVQTLTVDPLPGQTIDALGAWLSEHGSHLRAAAPPRVRLAEHFPRNEGTAASAEGRP